MEWSWTSPYVLGLGAVGLVLLIRVLGGSKDVKAKVSAYCEQPTKPQSVWRDKHILILVNPYGGSKKAKANVQEVVRPMFDKAGINYEIVSTTHSGHADELVQELDLAQYDAIVVVSGDGMFHEVLNSLAKRPDIDATKSLGIPVSLLPGGSSNGFTASFGVRNMFQGAKRFIESAARPMDLVQVREAGTDTILGYEAQQVSWGCFYDVDIMAEGPFGRMLGPAVKDIVVAFINLLARNIYHGRLLFKPTAVPAEHKGYYQSGDDLPDCQLKGYEGWKVMEGGFFMVTATNVSHAASDAPISPHKKCDDNSLDLFIVRDGPSRFQLLKIFLNIETPKAKPDKGVEMFKVSEFVLEPEGQSPKGRGGYGIDMSGIPYPLKGLHATLCKGAVQLVL